MKMSDMKLPKKTKKNTLSEAPVGMSEQEQYPYGLKIRLESEEIVKMPHLKGYKTGDEVYVSGIGKVVSTSMRETMGEKENRSMEIQLEKFGCEMQAEDNDEKEKELNDRAKYM